MRRWPLHPLVLQDREELVIDSFAGAGGASIGIERVIGRPVDIAINHDDAALKVHQLNHPRTLHYREDIWKVDPRTATQGQPVGLAHFSPDCTHFSKAKGATPRKKEIRGLAWVVLRWASQVQPRVIVLENVEEFQTWGPLTRKGQPCKLRKGETFERWLGHLRALGYVVEWRVLRACDYGAPTTRKRLFLVARCDGEPIVWPAPTHEEKKRNIPPTPLRRGTKRKPWRTAAECIDWTLPCPSIFDRKKPLAENTLRRVAKGIRRFVIECAEPFIVINTTGHASASIDDPLATVTTGNHHYLVAPTLIQTGYGEREGQAPRAPGLEKPIGTVTAVDHHSLVMPFLQRYQGPKREDVEFRGNGPGEPVGTVTAENRYGLIAPVLVGVGGRAGQSPPCGCDEPARTVTAKGDRAVVAAFLAKHYGQGHGADLRGPMPTITAGGMGHMAEVRAFLVKYYGSGGGQSCNEPMHTLTAKHRLGLVTVHGVDYQIVDIGMRMLQPHELARAQGFPDDYQIPGTKSAQVRMIGNSVCADMEAALVRANFKPRAIGARMQGPLRGVQG
ncbi:MAG: DNA cytosine methyltransferase [Candidatus Hydrogenedentes bacterium]|nr:DNA cytosine methyltransferase [Candidatus Hydrogenedentota bacterium]